MYVMGYSAKAVANYFLSEYRKNGITPLKLQKLVYISHGWYLAVHDLPLIDDEYAEAWPYGPVFPSLYHEFKHRGRMAILDLAKDIDVNDFDPDTLCFPSYTPMIKDNDTKIFLNKIWDVYGGYSGSQLSKLCHEPDSPWHKARKKDPNKRNPNIDENEIKKHYKIILQKNKSNHE